MAAFTAKNLSFTYSGSKDPALFDLSFEIQNGEFITLAGETGSGQIHSFAVLKARAHAKRRTLRKASF